MLEGDRRDRREAGAPRPRAVSVEPDDEILDIGSRRTPSRWLSLVVVIALASAVVALVAEHQHGSHHPQAAAVTVAVASPHTTTIPLPGGTPLPLDLAASGTRVWALQGGALTLVDDMRVGRTIHLSQSILQDLGPTAGLFVDSADNTIWLVGERARNGRMVELDSDTLATVRDVRWNQPVNDAAVLDGHLLLATDAGVADLAPGSLVPQPVPGLLGAIGPIAVDRMRDRLIVLDLGFPTTVWTYRPGRNPVQSSHNLPFASGTVQVAGGAIWVGGFGAGGAVLDRLDTTTLRPVAVSPLASELGPGAEVVSGGSQVFWVRGTGRGDALWCVDATTGLASQSWEDLAGPVVSQVSRGPVESRIGFAYVAPRGVLSSLALTTCAG